MNTFWSALAGSSTFFLAASGEWMLSVLAVGSATGIALLRAAVKEAK